MEVFKTIFKSSAVGTIVSWVQSNIPLPSFSTHVESRFASLNEVDREHGLSSPSTPNSTSASTSTSKSTSSLRRHPLLSMQLHSQGTNVSGGFAQSVALARIFLKKNAQVCTSV